MCRRTFVDAIAFLAGLIDAITETETLRAASATLVGRVVCVAFLNATTIDLILSIAPTPVDVSARSLHMVRIAARSVVPRLY